MILEIHFKTVYDEQNKILLNEQIIYGTVVSVNKLIEDDIISTTYSLKDILIYIEDNEFPNKPPMITRVGIIENVKTLYLEWDSEYSLDIELNSVKQVKNFPGV